ncbi:MAG: hypothetical protein OXR68_06960 [Alphaproteobacteria bacterium]|nr:hypothetical protein [Alphaproteobacteria bacterium]MDD9920344.1 hypothetical protein [Alphaproteobacteria bacterium]
MKIKPFYGPVISSKQTGSGYNDRYVINRDGPVEQQIRGAIALQKLHFIQKMLLAGRRGIADAVFLNTCFNGTINVNVGQSWLPKKPDYTFENVPWFDGYRLNNGELQRWTAVETFHLIKCHIIFDGIEKNGFIYLPDPKTKEAGRDFGHEKTTFEVIAPRIEGLAYGNEISVYVHPDKIELCKA